MPKVVGKTIKKYAGIAQTYFGNYIVILSTENDII